jgi:glycosyltransferase involved in cell wall biosynthesis
MRIVLCHNFYQQPGGEDPVFADEAWLLESRGHEVVPYTLHNREIDGMRRGQLLRKTIWNRQSYRELRQLIRRTRPALVHCHNTFPLISPACYAAARAEGVPVVQTLHNFRLLCPSALFLRQGKACEDCLGRVIAWPGILHQCYRKDWKATAVVTAMLSTHWLLRTWTRQVNRYIALSDFARQKFIQGGLPAGRIATKPNFLRRDPGAGAGEGGYALFVGRLSEEKGTTTLLSAWERLGQVMPLKIVGDGPLADEARAAAQTYPWIEWLGRRSPPEVLSLMGRAACLVVPSLCYENCPKVLLEAFAKGTPVIGSGLGSLAEMIGNGGNGLLFAAGNAGDLTAKVRQFAAANVAAFRRAARRAYEERYTAERAYPSIMNIYACALHDTGGRMAEAETARPSDPPTCNVPVGGPGP